MFNKYPGILALITSVLFGHSLSAGTIYRTGFETETDAAFNLPPTNITVLTDSSVLKHQHSPSIHKHSNGHLLITCRRDESKTAEGQDTNEQALYFSTDNGATWSMANGGYPIVTSNFGKYPGWVDSAVTQSSIYEDTSGNTWLYYTVNEPFTHSPTQPTMSTGGGQIRKVKLIYSGGDWVRSGATSVAWEFGQPIAGTTDTIRALGLNKIIRLSNGDLLMPIAGRKVGVDGAGAPYPLNRVWVLKSTDDGGTWSASYFVGGGGEPTIVETTAPGTVVMYCRSSPTHTAYQSTDYGQTWTGPVNTGLSNAGAEGSKPFLLKTSVGDYFLISANERVIPSRYNLSIYWTDNAGLIANRWKLCKTIRASSDSGTLGSCYAWIAEKDANNFHVVFVHDKFSTARAYDVLRFGTVSRAWLLGAEMEPSGEVYENISNTLPTFSTFRKFSGAKSFNYSNIRSKSNAPQFPGVSGYPIYLSQQVCVTTAPTTHDFNLIHLRSANGNDFGLAVALHPGGGNNNFWINANGTWLDTGIGYTVNAWKKIEVWLTSDTQFTARIDGLWVNGGLPMTKSGSAPISTYMIGGNWTSPVDGSGIWQSSAAEPCSIYVDDVIYGSLANPLVYECERLLPLAASSGDSVQATNFTDANAYSLLEYVSNGVNDYVTVNIHVPEAATYNVKVRHRRAAGRPICQLSIDGADQGGAIDLYNPTLVYTEYDLGNRYFGVPGDKQFKFLVTGKNASATDWRLYIDCIKLTKQ